MGKLRHREEKRLPAPGMLRLPSQSADFFSPYLGELLTLGVAWGMGRGGGDSQKAELGYCGSSSLIFSGSGDR